ncbi:hypothetical protein FRUB_09013 [Fimbriiglobus ruber]|uniref:Uncharacterized protein n=2 Tax=Fimbriiglobus ruber TaxID=1908690 RepID=A0A225D4D8_9BACT|nr:hypothetical protein FRUB_09013 [Fimbriiglobus ruber]
MREEYSAWGWADPLLELTWYDHPEPRPFPSGKQLSQLLVLRHRDRGFYFEFNDYIGRVSGGWLVAIDPAGDRSEWVSNMSHGEEAFFLAACFLPQTASERVVADFMVGGNLSPETEWVSFGPLCPRRDYPSE